MNHDRNAKMFKKYFDISTQNKPTKRKSVLRGIGYIILHGNK